MIKSTSPFLVKIVFRSKKGEFRIINNLLCKGLHRSCDNQKMQDNEILKLINT
jgi:hypothetical protein